MAVYVYQCGPGLAEIEKACAERGLVVEDVFEDGAWNRGRLWQDRSQAGALSELLVPGDLVVTKNLLSIGQSHRHQLEALLDAETRGYVWVFAAARVAGRSESTWLEASGAQLDRLLQAVRSWKSEAHGKAISKGMNERKAAGKRHCHHPGYGMRWFRGRKVPCQQELEAVRRVVEMKQAGHSFYEIARAFMYDRVKTKNGGEWSRERVVRTYRWAMRQPQFQQENQHAEV